MANDTGRTDDAVLDSAFDSIIGGDADESNGSHFVTSERADDAHACDDTHRKKHRKTHDDDRHVQFQDSLEASLVDRVRQQLQELELQHGAATMDHSGICSDAIDSSSADPSTSTKPSVHLIRNWYDNAGGPRWFVGCLGAFIDREGQVMNCKTTRLSATDMLIDAAEALTYVSRLSTVRPMQAQSSTASPSYQTCPQDLETVWPEHVSRYLFEASAVVGARPCVFGVRCKAFLHLPHPRTTPQQIPANGHCGRAARQSSGGSRSREPAQETVHGVGIILREFLSPKAEREFYATGHLPDQHGPCIICMRCMVRLGMQKVSLGQADRCLPPHCNAVGTFNAYKEDSMIKTNGSITGRSTMGVCLPFRDYCTSDYHATTLEDCVRANILQPDLATAELRLIAENGERQGYFGTNGRTRPCDIPSLSSTTGAVYSRAVVDMQASALAAAAVADARLCAAAASAATEAVECACAKAAKASLLSSKSEYRKRLETATHAPSADNEAHDANASNAADAALPAVDGDAFGKRDAAAVERRQRIALDAAIHVLDRQERDVAPRNPRGYLEDASVYFFAETRWLSSAASRAYNSSVACVSRHALPPGSLVCLHTVAHACDGLEGCCQFAAPPVPFVEVAVAMSTWLCSLAPSICQNPIRQLQQFNLLVWQREHLIVLKRPCAGGSTSATCSITASSSLPSDGNAAFNGDSEEMPETSGSSRLFSELADTVSNCELLEKDVGHDDDLATNAASDALQVPADTDATRRQRCGCYCRCHTRLHTELIASAAAASSDAAAVRNNILRDGCHRCKQFHIVRRTVRSGAARTPLDVHASGQRLVSAIIRSGKLQRTAEQHPCQCPSLLKIPFNGSADARMLRTRVLQNVAAKQSVFGRHHSSQRTIVFDRLRNKRYKYATTTYMRGESRVSVLRHWMRSHKRRAHDITESRARKLFAQTIMKHWKVPVEWQAIAKALAERYVDEYRVTMIPAILMLPMKYLCPILAAALNPWVTQWWQVQFDSPCLRLLEVIAEFVQSLALWETVAYPACPWKHTIAIACAARIEVAEEILCIVRNEHALIRANKGIRIVDDAMTEYEEATDVDSKQQAAVRLFEKQRDKEHSTMLSTILTRAMATSYGEERQTHRRVDCRTDRDDVQEFYQRQQLAADNMSSTAASAASSITGGATSLTVLSVTDTGIKQRRLGRRARESAHGKDAAGTKQQTRQPQRSAVTQSSRGSRRRQADKVWTSHGPRVLDRNGSAAEALIAAHWPLCELFRNNTMEALCEDSDIADWIACTGFAGSSNDSLPIDSRPENKHEGGIESAGNPNPTPSFHQERQAAGCVDVCINMPWRRCAGQCQGVVYHGSADIVIGCDANLWSEVARSEWEGTDAAAMRMAAVIDSAIITHDGHNEEQRRHAHDKQHGYSYSHTYGGAMTGEGGGAKTALDTLSCYCGCNDRRQLQSEQLPACPRNPNASNYKRGRGRPKKSKHPPPPPVSPVYCFTKSKYDRRQPDGGRFTCAAAGMASAADTNGESTHQVEICIDGKCLGAKGNMSRTTSTPRLNLSSTPTTQYDLNELEKRTAKRTTEQIDRDIDALECLVKVINVVGIPVLGQYDPEDRLANPCVPRADDVDALETISTMMKTHSKVVQRQKHHSHDNVAASTESQPPQTESRHAEETPHEPVIDNAARNAMTIPSALSHEYETPSVAKQYGLHSDDRTAMLMYPSSEEMLSSALESAHDPLRNTRIPIDVTGRVDFDQAKMKSCNEPRDILWPRNTDVVFVLTGKHAKRESLKLHDVLSFGGLRHTICALTTCPPSSDERQNTERCAELWAASGGLDAVLGRNVESCKENPWVQPRSADTWYIVTAVLLRCSVAKCILEQARKWQDYQLLHAATTFIQTHNALIRMVQDNASWKSVEGFRDCVLMRPIATAAADIEMYSSSIFDSAYPCDRLAYLGTANVDCADIVNKYICELLPHNNDNIGTVVPSSLSGSKSDIIRHVLQTFTSADVATALNSELQTSLDTAVSANTGDVVPWITGLIEQTLVGSCACASEVAPQTLALQIPKIALSMASTIASVVMQKYICQILGNVVAFTTEIERLGSFTTLEFAACLEEAHKCATLSQEQVSYLNVLNTELRRAERGAIPTIELLCVIEQCYRTIHQTPATPLNKCAERANAAYRFLVPLLDSRTASKITLLVTKAMPYMLDEAGSDNVLVRCATERIIAVMRHICKTLDDSDTSDIHAATAVAGRDAPTFTTSTPYDALESLREIMYGQTGSAAERVNDLLKRLRIAAIYWNVCCYTLRELGELVYVLVMPQYNDIESAAVRKTEICNSVSLLKLSLMEAVVGCLTHTNVVDLDMTNTICSRAAATLHIFDEFRRAYYSDNSNPSLANISSFADNAICSVIASMSISIAPSASPDTTSAVQMPSRVRLGPVSEPTTLQVAQMAEFVSAMLHAECTWQGQQDIIRCLSFGWSPRCAIDQSSSKSAYETWRDKSVQSRFGSSGSTIHDMMLQAAYTSIAENSRAARVMYVMSSAMSERTITAMMMQYGAGSWDDVRAQFGAFVCCHTCDRILTQMHVVPSLHFGGASSVGGPMGPSTDSKNSNAPHATLLPTDVPVDDNDDHSDTKRSDVAVARIAGGWRQNGTHEYGTKKPPLNTNFRGKDASVIGLYGVSLCLATGNLVCAEGHANGDTMLEHYIARGKILLNAWKCVIATQTSADMVNDKDLGIHTVSFNGSHGVHRSRHQHNSALDLQNLQELRAQYMLRKLDLGISTVFAIGVLVEIHKPRGMHAHKEDEMDSNTMCVLCCECGAMMRISSTDYTADGHGWECVACQIAREKAPAACRICGAPLVRRMEHGLLLAERCATSAIQKGQFHATQPVDRSAFFTRTPPAHKEHVNAKRPLSSQQNAGYNMPDGASLHVEPACKRGRKCGDVSISRLSSNTPYNISTICNARDTIAGMIHIIASSRAKRQSSEMTDDSRGASVSYYRSKRALELHATNARLSVHQAAASAPTREGARIGIMTQDAVRRDSQVASFQADPECDDTIFVALPRDTESPGDEDDAGNVSDAHNDADVHTTLDTSEITEQCEQQSKGKHGRHTKQMDASSTTVLPEDIHVIGTDVGRHHDSRSGERRCPRTRQIATKRIQPAQKTGTTCGQVGNPTQMASSFVLHNMACGNSNTRTSNTSQFLTTLSMKVVDDYAMTGEVYVDVCDTCFITCAAFTEKNITPLLSELRRCCHDPFVTTVGTPFDPHVEVNYDCVQLARGTAALHASTYARLQQNELSNVVQALDTLRAVEQVDAEAEMQKQMQQQKSRAQFLRGRQKLARDRALHNAKKD